ncbi:hypothetical protein GDO86_014229 [Hymenochirus boettgeri]|uniref:Gastrin/cholecystokinin peptide hormone domain-containing protein n=1 Tax=Hymenochirus boettgeri TaxID=247094 RepID=A0A8T2JT77_9PIPI|nr:hypothetical protein GDO86_014229 [Hymenochirus boettgeri]
MHRKGYISMLLAILATSSLCRPMMKLETTHHTSVRKTPNISELSRRDLFASLTHDQKQLMSQLLPQFYAERSNGKENLQESDYGGWMDFGRRSLEDPNPVSY